MGNPTTQNFLDYIDLMNQATLDADADFIVAANVLDPSVQKDIDDLKAITRRWSAKGGVMSGVWDIHSVTSSPDFEAWIEAEIDPGDGTADWMEIPGTRVLISSPSAGDRFVFIFEWVFEAQGFRANVNSTTLNGSNFVVANLRLFAPRGV